MISEIRELNDADLETVAGGLLGEIIQVIKEVTRNSSKVADKYADATDAILRG